jgi:glycosyltransferase involved in cell wall biosynthesis
MKILGIGDFARETGFGRVNHAIFGRLVDKGHDVVWMGWNYHGDPHPILQRVKTYSAAADNPLDFYGIGRIENLILKEKPDIIILHGDSWSLEGYIPILQKFDIPSVFFSPVDCEYLPKKYVFPLNFFVGGMCYTQWGSDQLYQRGLYSHIPVFPTLLGAEDHFYPIPDKKALRLEAGIPEQFLDVFIVLAVDRNSSRKNIGDAIQCLNFWMEDKNIEREKVLFWFHGSTNDEGPDLEQIAVNNNVRIMFTSKQMKSGAASPEFLNKIYNVADVRVSMSGAEGFSLPTLEAMKTQLPNLVLNYSAIPSWAEDGVVYLEPQRLRTYQYSNYPTTPHARVDPVDFIVKIDRMYRDPIYRREIAIKGWEVANQPKFDWDNIANDVGDYLDFLYKKYQLQKLQEAQIEQSRIEQSTKQGEEGEDE